MGQEIIHEAVSVPNNLPAFIPAIPGDVLDKRDQLVALAGIYLQGGIKDAEAFATADALNGKIKELEGWLEEERKRLKAPILKLTRDFDDAFAEAATPLIATRTPLAKLVIDYRNAENERRRKEHEEALRKAEEERAEQERLAKAEADRIAAEKAAAAPAQQSPDDDSPPPLDDAPTEAPARVVMVPQRYVPPPAMLASSSAKVIPKKKLVIDNPDLIPRTAGMAVLMEPVEKEIIKQWKAGHPVAGTRYIDDVPTISAKG